MAPDIYVQTCSLHPASINLNSSPQKWRGKSALKEYSGEENALEKLLQEGENQEGRCDWEEQSCETGV